MYLFLGPCSKISTMIQELLVDMAGLPVALSEGWVPTQHILPGLP